MLGDVLEVRSNRRHVVADAGERRDHRRDALPRIHERLVLVDDGTASHLHDGDLYDAMTVPCPASGGLDIDHSERHLRQRGTERRQRGVETPDTLSVHQKSRIGPEQLENGRRSGPWMPCEPEHVASKLERVRRPVSEPNDRTPDEGRVGPNGHSPAPPRVILNESASSCITRLTSSTGIESGTLIWTGAKLRMPLTPASTARSAIS